MPEIHIVDLHHEVLPVWAECAAAAGQPPQVLSLDFHTDVLNCRNRLAEMPETAREAVSILHHDEHFDWALRKKIISRAVIIALSPCAVPPEHPALEVRRSPLLPDMDTMLNDPENFRPVARMVLDDRFLAPLLPDDFPEQPYILDIDCDCILCEKAMFPEEDRMIRKLFSRAMAVTLSREDAWVKILKLPGENISGNLIAQTLTSRFSVK